MVAAARSAQPPQPLEPAHNLLLLALDELGPVGAGLLIALIGVVGWQIVRQRPHPGAALFGAALVGVLVAAQFDHFWWTLGPGRDAFWLAVGLWQVYTKQDGQDWHGGR